MLTALPGKGVDEDATRLFTSLRPGILSEVHGREILVAGGGRTYASRRR